MKINQILPVEECAFEPDSAEVPCMDCEKPTGVTGTCKDVALCADCRAGYLAAGISEREVSEMLITMIEGRGYKSKYKPSRVLHLSVNGIPACGVKGGPHPMTENTNDTNCKRCLSSRQSNQEKGNQ